MFSELLRYVKIDKKTLYSMLTFTIASSLLILAIPFLVQTLIQQYTLLVFQQSTLFLILSVGLFLTAITVMRVLQMHLSEHIQRRLFLRAVEDAQKSWKAAHSKNRPMNKKKWNFIFESVSLQKSIIPLFFDGFTFLLQSILVMVLISIYHPFFMIYSLLLMLAFYWVTVVMGKSTLKYAFLESTKKHNLIYELQTESSDPLTDDHYSDQILDYFITREKRHSSYVKQSIGLFIIKILAAVLLLVIGGLLVFQNQMTIGQLIASELIVTNLLISLFKFSNLLDYYYDASAAVRKLQLLQEENAP